MKNCPYCDSLVPSSSVMLAPDNIRSMMEEDGRCYSCARWADILSVTIRDPWRHIVADGIYYVAAPEGTHTGESRGHRGRRFLFRRISDGSLLETTNLWVVGRADRRPILMRDTHALIEEV